MKTSNEIAILLVFYHLYQRHKLNLNDLKKIVAKYYRKPLPTTSSSSSSSTSDGKKNTLLTDLWKKYPENYYDHFEEVEYDAVIYIIQKNYVEIPKEFLQVLQKDYDALTLATNSKTSFSFTSLAPYQSQLDITSNDFDPLRALNSRSIISSVRNSLVQDNLSRVTELFPPSVTFEKKDGMKLACQSISTGNDIDSMEVIMASWLSQKAGDDDQMIVETSNDDINPAIPHFKSLRERIYEKRQKDKELELLAKQKIDETDRSKHIFERIADLSVPKYLSINYLGEKIPLASPLDLLYTFMKEKNRIRVIIRKRNSLRGFMDGYLLGFDKYFNLLMKDCDEEYLPNHAVS